MQSKEEIYTQLVDIMADLFDIEAAAISPTSSLIEDLDIDSIDAVDMAVRLNELTGKKILPNEFKGIKTVQDVVDVVDELVNAKVGA